MRQLCLMALSCCFSTGSTPAMEVKYGESIIYEIFEYSSTENIVTVQVKLPELHMDNRLILRGKCLGVDPQIQKMICDGDILKEEGKMPPIKK